MDKEKQPTTPTRNPDQKFILELLKHNAQRIHSLLYIPTEPELAGPRFLDRYLKKHLSAIRYIENLPNDLTFGP
jgi:hypothetical protein